MKRIGILFVGMTLLKTPVRGIAKFAAVAEIGESGIVKIAINVLMESPHHVNTVEGPGACWSFESLGRRKSFIGNAGAEERHCGPINQEE